MVKPHSRYSKSSPKQYSDELAPKLKDQIIKQLQSVDIYSMKPIALAHGDIFDFQDCDARVICVSENDSQSREVVGKFAEKHGKFPFPSNMQIGDVFHMILRTSKPAILIFMVVRKHENEIVQFDNFEKCMPKLNDLLHSLGVKRIAMPLFSFTSEKLKNAFFLSMIHKYILEEFEVTIVFRNAFYHRIISESLKVVYKDLEEEIEKSE